jgi:hypothetical protein
VLNGRTQPADAASASQIDAAAGAAAGSSGLRLPQTLPGVRSWRGADTAAGGSSGWNPSLTSGTVGGSMQSPNRPISETGMRQRAQPYMGLRPSDSLGFCSHCRKGTSLCCAVLCTRLDACRNVSKATCASSHVLTV